MFTTYQRLRLALAWPLIQLAQRVSPEPLSITTTEDRDQQITQVYNFAFAKGCCTGHEVARKVRPDLQAGWERNARLALARYEKELTVKLEEA